MNRTVILASLFYSLEVSMLKYIFILFFSTMSYAFSSQLTDVLIKYKNDYALVLPAKYQLGKIKVLDVSKDSRTFKNLNILSTAALVKHSKQLRKNSKADMLVGRYLEDRNIYQRGKQYNNHMKEPRSVHLGIDLMVPEGTAVFAPIAGKVHSFKDNNEVADYGPTIILEHHLDGITFYTLYGHLSRDSLKSLQVEQVIRKGQQIASVGTPSENGGWPEHLHFQIIDNMQGQKGNFIGVVEPSNVLKWAKHCPDPNLILNIQALDAYSDTKK